MSRAGGSVGWLLCITGVRPTELGGQGRLAGSVSPFPLTWVWRPGRHRHAVPESGVSALKCTDRTPQAGGSGGVVVVHARASRSSPRGGGAVRKGARPPRPAFAYSSSARKFDSCIECNANVFVFVSDRFQMAFGKIINRRARLNT